MILATAASSGSGGSSNFLLIFMVLAVVALIFMNSRARKRQAAASAFRNTLQPGQEVMTGSGMFGTVTAVDGDRVTIASSGGQESEWMRAAIAKVVEPETDDDTVDADGARDDESAADDPTTRYVEGAADVPTIDLGPDGGTTPRDDTSR